MTEQRVHRNNSSPTAVGPIDKSVPSAPRHLLLLPRFGRSGANSRYRLWQFIPLFEAAGYNVDIAPLLGDDYLTRLYGESKRSLIRLSIAYLLRIYTLRRIRKYSAILLDQEMLPYMPAWIERSVSAIGARVIVDYDDGAYCKYVNRVGLRGKIPQIMKVSAAVVVGNHHLATYAQSFAKTVCLIPTVVDIDKYVPKQGHRPDGVLRICWIGTPITAKRFLVGLVPVLREVQRRFPNVLFRFIGSGTFPGADELRAEYMQWSEATEASLITAADIGIMPLPDCEFERGKCGLKLIQYMAAGLPVVASPVGENRYIVEEGGNGFFATNSGEWIEHLSLLVCDSALRSRMGARGREIVEQRYCLRYAFQEWKTLLDDVLGLKAI